MKALSIRQPWVWAIMSAGKRVENREWSTRYRGPLLIHAAKGLTKNEYAEFALWWQRDFPRRPLQSYPALPAMEQLERGGIVGTCRLIDVIEDENAVPDGISPVRAELFINPWFFGRYGFVLADVKPIQFIPYKGELGLFEVPESVLGVAA